MPKLESPKLGFTMTGKANGSSKVVSSGLMKKAFGHRDPHFLGDAADEGLVVAVGQALRAAAGVGDAQHLQQRRHVQLLARVVVVPLVAEVEHEVDLAHESAQVVDQRVVIVEIGEADNPFSSRRASLSWSMV